MTAKTVRPRRTWNVREFRAELEVLTAEFCAELKVCTSGMDVDSLGETKRFAWDLACEMLWTLPVAPLYFVRGGLSEIVEDVATKAWHRWYD